MKIILNGNRSFRVTELEPSETKFLLDFFKFSVPVRKYDWRTKTWNFHAGSEDKIIPKVIDAYTLEFGLGYIFVVTNLLYPKMSKEDVAIIKDKFVNTDLVISNYYGLEDIDGTHERLNTLLKFKRGMMQLPTGKGKTEMIACVTKNILNRFEKVLIISETTPVLDEIRSRLESYGINVPKYFDKDQFVNVIKPTGFCRNGLYNEDAIRDYFSQVKYLIADEVETVITASFQNLFTKMPNVDYLYGFSASVNKAKSTNIPKGPELRDVLNGQISNLISYFGFTACDVRPSGRNINLHQVILPIRVHPDVVERNAIIRNTFRNKPFLDSIRVILDRGETLFVPINNREALEFIIKDQLRYRTKILMISGDGYQVIDESGTKNVDLGTAKYYVESKNIRLVLGTSTSYRGIDFKGLTSIYLTFDAQSAIMRQCIGRSREQSFNVYLLKPIDKISYLTSAYWSNYKEIKDYYSLCKIWYEKLEL